MSLRDDSKLIAETYHCVTPTLVNNAEVLDIYEGNLLPYIDRDLKEQLSKRAYQSAKTRIPPINLLKRVIDKLSQIYTEPPTRIVEGTSRDQENWDWYLDQFNINVMMQLANEYFNQHKATLLEPYLDYNFRPKLRAVPYDRFFTLATDLTDPLRVTHVVKIMGKKKQDSYDKAIFYAYTDNEFLIIDENGEPMPDLMSKYQLDGSNPYGKIPFVYINRSMIRVNPMADTDLMAMSRLVPILFTDINYALMYQAFSIIYGIDVEAENIELNPNAFLSLKSDPTSNKNPEIGQIKPQIDSEKAIAAIQEQLALWMQSRNIRPGSIGRLGVENFNSGISKMVDEMDTTADRKKQIPYFEKAEEELYNLIAFHMHPIWSRNPSFDSERIAQFSVGSTIDVDFPDQVTMQTRSEQVDEIIKEVNAGLLSRETAFIKLNPDLEESQIKEELSKIGLTVEVTEPVEGDNGDEVAEIQD